MAKLLTFGEPWVSDVMIVKRAVPTVIESLPDPWYGFGDEVFAFLDVFFGDNEVDLANIHFCRQVDAFNHSFFFDDIANRHSSGFFMVIFPFKGFVEGIGAEANNVEGFDGIKPLILRSDGVLK